MKTGLNATDFEFDDDFERRRRKRERREEGGRGGRGGRRRS